MGYSISRESRQRAVGDGRRLESGVGRPPRVPPVCPAPRVRRVRNLQLQRSPGIPVLQPTLDGGTQGCHRVR